MKEKSTIRLWIVVSVVLIAALAVFSGPDSSTPTAEPTTPPTAEPTTPPPPTATEPELMPTEAPAPEPVVDENAQVTASGLQYVEVQAGDGPTPQEGEIVFVHYTGMLQDGTVFDSSRERGEPIQFALGRGMVIPGWDEGIGMMKEGGQARLIIPPELAYGASGAGGVIPPNATLIFEVELVSIQAGSPDAPTQVDEADYVTTDSGLKYYDIEVGDGPAPQANQTVAVHYTGWLLDGTKFDSSLDRGQPLSFVIGVGQMIPGFDEGVATMNIGGKRQLMIPPELAYGEQGAGGVIPPNATIIFDVELVDAR